MRNYQNSTIVRAQYRWPTHDWMDNMEELHWIVASMADGEVDTAPGPAPGEIDWLFEHEADAAWFVLKYSGQIIQETTTPSYYDLSRNWL